MGYNMGGSKRLKCNDQYFVIIRFRNMIKLPTDVSKSCDLSECRLYSFKHLIRYNRAKTKTCHLPGNGPSNFLNFHPLEVVFRYHRPFDRSKLKGLISALITAA